MEKETIAEYSKEYSEIEGLQRAARVEYRLRRTQTALLLEATLTPRDTSEGKTMCCLLHGMTEDFAKMLARYVYENGVMPAQLRDVLQDCCGACMR